VSQVFAGLDVLVVNDKHFAIHIGDVGINAQIVAAYSKDKNRGMATYAKYFIDELNNLEPFDITVEANNKTITEKGLMAGLCNARKYGTGIPINIQGNPMDGKFEIVILKSLELPSLIKAGLSKFDERFYDSQNSLVISTDKAQIRFSKPMLLQLDGEVIGKFKKLDIAILKHAVTFITHKNNTYLQQVK
jgi:diacylglycerol kinase family enzyme